MRQIIEVQGVRKLAVQPGHLTLDILAPADGVVTEIDNFQLARIARLAGAPMDKGAGVDLLKKLGDPVRKGETLYRLHAEFPADFRFASRHAGENSGYAVGAEADIPPGFVVS
jgi:thymidine phosphorylase